MMHTFANALHHISTNDSFAYIKQDILF